MQKELCKNTRLLDDKGELIDTGYAKSLLLEYDRGHIKAAKHRIKEWDYYLVANDKYAVALTIADNSYMGLMSVSLIDFKKPWEKTTSVMTAFPMGKTKLPPSSKSGDVCFNNSRCSFSFTFENNKRRLICKMGDFCDKKEFSCNILLDCEPEESMVIATPYKEDKKAFYYNQKINCMRASGTAHFDGNNYEFSPVDSFGTLDWGRGVWTYSNTWYWGSLSGQVNGKTFGFNIGYGFGDCSAASENMLFYDGKAHKLEQVTFNIPKNDKGAEDYLKPWSFSSSDGRLEMNFVPIIDRAACTSVVVIKSDQHQVFGLFSGAAILDDGTKVEIKDMLGFAEKVMNRW